MPYFYHFVFALTPALDAAGGDEMLMMTQPRAPRCPSLPHRTAHILKSKHEELHHMESFFHILGRFRPFLVFGISSAAGPSIIGGQGFGLGKKERRRGGGMSEALEKETAEGRTQKVIKPKNEELKRE